MYSRSSVACCLSLLLSSGIVACRKPQPKVTHSEQAKAQPSFPSPPKASNQALTPPVMSRPSGPIRFVDVTDAAGIHFRHNSGAFGKKYLPETMGSGVCVIDYDGDGWQDILFVNSMDWPEHKVSISTPALYHNNHDGTFTDVTHTSGLAKEMYGLGCAVGDFDNDGRDDIYITALGGNYLFRNLGGGRFTDVTAKAHVRDAEIGRASCRERV